MQAQLEQSSLDGVSFRFVSVVRGENFKASGTFRQLKKPCKKNIMFYWIFLLGEKGVG